MRKRLFFLKVVFGMLMAGELHAYSGLECRDEIPLRLKTGMITEAEFPDKVANVTKSVSGDSLQIETTGNRMFLLAKKDFDSKVYVVTQDNISYCLHLIMDDAQGATRIKIKKPDQAKDEARDKETVNTVELMKALMSGRQPEGSVSSKLYREEIFNNGQLRIVADEVYELANNVKAFVLTFENLTSKPMVVPVEHIEIPGLLAISVENSILEAGSSDPKKKALGSAVKAYMVAEGMNP